MSDQTVTTPPTEEPTNDEPQAAEAAEQTAAEETAAAQTEQAAEQTAAEETAAEETAEEEPAEAEEPAATEETETTAATEATAAEETETADDAEASPAPAQEPEAKEPAEPATEPAGATAEAEAAKAAEPAAAAPKPAKPAVPKPAAPRPSPAAFAGKSHGKPASFPSAFSDEDVKAAAAFGRVSEDGTIFVKDGDDERAVGQYKGSDPDKALEEYARRYLELKAKLDQFRVRLQSSQIKPGEISRSLSQLLSEVAEPQVVGDMDALRAEFGELKVAGDEKKEQLEKERKEAYDKALAERTAIVEKAEALASSLGDNTNWNNTGDEFGKLFDQWQAHQKSSPVRLNKTDADALWNRFSASRSTFTAQRRKWSQERDAHRAEVRAAKEQIIKEAEAIKDSTDWAATASKFADLMARWKKAGHVGRNEDDALWERFHAAQDTFFTARNADRDKVSEDEKENLAKKEALLERAQKLVPVANVQEAKKARQELGKIQEEWDAIGHVPRGDVHRLESALDGVERQIKAVEDAEWKKSDPEVDERKSDFVRQLEAKVAELDEQIAAEKDPKKKAALEADKAGWEKLIPSK